MREFQKISNLKTHDIIVKLQTAEWYYTNYFQMDSVIIGAAYDRMVSQKQCYKHLISFKRWLHSNALVSHCKVTCVLGIQGGC